MARMVEFDWLVRIEAGRVATLDSPRSKYDILYSYYETLKKFAEAKKYISTFKSTRKIFY